MLDFLQNLRVLVFQSWKHAKHESWQRQDKLLLHEKDVVLDQVEEALLHLESSKLVEVEQTTEKERNAWLSVVRTNVELLLVLVHELNFTLKHLFVDFKRQLMNNIDFRIKTLSKPLSQISLPWNLQALVLLDHLLDLLQAVAQICPFSGPLEGIDDVFETSVKQFFISIHLVAICKSGF